MKNFILTISILLSIVSISSCCKPAFSYQTILRNTTDQEIKLLYFKYDQAKSIIINPKSQKIGDGPFYDPAETKDSVLVYRNGILKEIHYPQSNKKTISNAEVFPSEHPRNLINRSSYKSTREDLPCDGFSIMHLYTF